MDGSVAVGLYGKLPAYGDFLKRNLSNELLQPWDEWLQAYVSVSKEQVGANWLDIYLTSPIWRFALSAGVINEHAWAGLIMPSVDRVGRYFPFSILLPLTGNTSPVKFLLLKQQWFKGLETLSLQALDELIDIDELLIRIEQPEINDEICYLPTTHYGDPGDFITEIHGDDDSAINESLPYLLDATLAASLNSYSLWQTSGSSLIAPSLFCTRALPPVRNLTAMMDGQWQSRGWKIPFNLNV